MIFASLDRRTSFIIRLLGCGLITWTVINASKDGPGTSGRPLVVTILLALCVTGACLWLAGQADLDRPPGLEVPLLAIAGGALVGASPGSAASAFAFVAIVTAGIRAGLVRAMQVTAVATLSLAVTVLIWDGGALGLLAYALGFAVSGLAAANVRQLRLQAEQAELLLAQSQRSQEESLRAARLEESTRIAREIHDVLAHSLAGLTIQLEATTALLENGADPETILPRVRRAHELARDGMRETRRAVGALRGDGPSTEEALATLATAESTSLTIDGDASWLSGDAGRAVLRVVQESLTNVSKHAPGSQTTIAITIGEREIVAMIENRLAEVPVTAGPLAASGGGYGIPGMRERAGALAGTLSAGPTDTGWRVELRIPTRAEATE
jgi:signal transduction histidine kinase